MSHDPATTPNKHFPQLTPQNHRITSPATPEYNCAAWAAGDTTRWWEPEYFWPIQSETASDRDLRFVFESIGYQDCLPEFNTTHEYVVIYSHEGEATHVARRLSTGKWTSKLGKWQDIEHDSEHDVAGGTYSAVMFYMCRVVAAI